MKKCLMIFMTVFVLFSTALSGCGQRDASSAAVIGNEPLKSSWEGDALNPANPLHPSTFVTKSDLYNCLVKMEDDKENIAKGKQIIGGVVPHHLAAGHLTARLIKNIAQNPPPVIVLVGPNHNNAGGKVITGLYDWQTPEGIIKTDRKTVQRLIDKKLAVLDEKVMSTEHSIGAVVPFIRHFMPETFIVPLILHHDVSVGEVDAILETLKESLGENTVILGSVDFSHYLTRREAEEKDKVTLKAMRAFDYKALYGMSSDYLDSPASLALVFRYAEGKGIQEFQVLDNTNSGIILKNETIETTSYFTILFEEK